MKVDRSYNQQIYIMKIWMPEIQKMLLLQQITIWERDSDLECKYYVLHLLHACSLVVVDGGGGDTDKRLVAKNLISSYFSEENNLTIQLNKNTNELKTQYTEITMD